MKILNKDFWGEVFTKVFSNVIVSIIISIITIVFFIIISIYDPFKKLVEENIPVSSLIIIIFILLISLISSIMYVGSLKKKLSQKLKSILGVYWDKELNIYCPSCKSMLTNYAFYDTGRKHEPGIKCIKCNQILHFSDEKKRFYDLGEAKQIVRSIITTNK